jgi:hypothetical protein
MAMMKATIAVSSHITVSGTLMTASMMINPPAPGKTKVLCNGEVFEGTLLGKPIPVESSAASDEDITTADLVDVALG